MEYQIPFVDQEVSTSDPSGSLTNLAEGALGITTLFALTAAGSYLFSRVKSGAGVEGNTEIPVA